MAQYKKDNVRQEIEEAALRVFSQKGYLDTKISDIAAYAGVSVGNMYRYYKNKDEIFYSVVPDSFLRSFRDTVRDKISAARDGIGRTLQEAADSLIRFMLLHRERITIMFRGSKGTRYQSFKTNFADELILVVKAYYKEKYMSYIKRYGNDAVLRLVYENLINAYGFVLSQNCSEEEIAAALSQVNLYHFSGIISLLGI